ncbi:hypothetical protein C6P45_003090, partial [Maudiozyma exigua]
IDDWCVQARRLYRGDCNVLHQIENLTKLPLGKTFWKEFDVILKSRHDLLLPILYKITTEQSERNSYIEYDLELKTCAQHLLDNILHGPFYELAWRSVGNNFPEAEYLEPLFLDIAKFDSAYPLISGKVLDVRKRIRRRIDRKIKGAWNVFWSDTTVSKTRLIISATLKALRISKCKNYIPEKRVFNEDCFITRIYAGEVIGHRFLLLVILQSICRQYKITSRVSYDYLIIEDPTDPDGQLYFTLGGTHVERKLIFHKELRAMMSTPAAMMMRSVDSLLAEYLQPLNGIQCLNFVMLSLNDTLEGSISRFYESFPDPSIIKIDYTPIYEADYCNKPLNSFKRSHYIKKLFPFSKRCIADEVYSNMEKIYTYTRHICERPAVGDWENYDLKSNDWYKDLRKLVLTSYPWDHNHIIGCDTFDLPSDYIITDFEDESAIVKYEEIYATTVNVGTFMRWREEELVLILCEVNVQMNRKNLGITHALTCEGLNELIHVEDLDSGSTHPVTLTEINTFIKTVAPLNKLGMIFKFFSSYTGFGELNIKTISTIERGLQERTIITFAENVKRLQKIDKRLDAFNI